MLEHIDTCVATRINKTQIVYEICLGLVFAYPTVRNQEAGHPGKLATDFLQLLVLHEMSKKLYHWKA